MSMTSSPTLAVLPDTRARDLADAKAWLCARWHQAHPNEQHIMQLADYAAHLRATPPASDAAVPAGGYEARFVAGGAPTDCVDYGVVSLSKGKEVCRVWEADDARLIANLLNAAAAPKVASERYSDEDEALYTRWLAGDETLLLPRDQHLRFQARIDRETRERAR